MQSFNEIARHRHRYDVFREFVTMAATSVHNAVNKSEALEAEYLAIIGGYEADEQARFPSLFAQLVKVPDTEPWDALGQLYMELSFSSGHVGQFFTPPELSELMARPTYGDAVAKLESSFVTAHEPACGAGGMILALAKVMLDLGHNPAEKLWVQCWDIDRTVAPMCCLQLSLWNIPGVVVVGNTLSMEARERFYTPAHFLGGWGDRLAARRACEVIRDLMPADKKKVASKAVKAAQKASEIVGAAMTTIEPIPKLASGAVGTQEQFDFRF